MTTIHDRVRLIKNAIATQTGGATEGITAPHAPTHPAGGSDPIRGRLTDPQNADQINGIGVDTDGIADGQSLVYDAGLDQFVPGDGGYVPDHAATHATGGGDPIRGRLTDPQNADQLDGVPVVIAGLTDQMVLGYDAGTETFKGLDMTTVVNRQTAYDNGQTVEVTGAPYVTKAILSGAPIQDYAKSELARQIVSTGSGDHDFQQVVLGGTAGLILANQYGPLTFQDVNTTSPISFSEGGETALDTTSQSIIGSINEIHSEVSSASTLQSVLDAGSTATIAGAIDIVSSGAAAKLQSGGTANASLIAAGTATVTGAAVAITATTTDVAIIAQGVNRSINLQALSTGGDVTLASADKTTFLDGNTALPIALSETGISEFPTAKKSILGATSELNDKKGNAFPGICTETPLPASAFSIDYTTRVLTITPPLGYFHFHTDGGGVVTKHEKTGAVNFPAFTNTSGMWYFYFDAAGDPITTQLAWDDFNIIAPVYRILWNATLSPDSARSVGEAWEAHSNDISAADHAWKHRQGTIWYSGQEIFSNAIASGTPNASGLNTCIGMSGGLNIDDNLLYSITNGTGSSQWTQDLGTNTPASLTTSNGGKFLVRYQDSGGLLSNIDSGRFPFAFSAGNLIEFITSAGVRTVPSSGNFVVYYLYAFQDPRNGKQIKSVSSGAEYTTLTAAQANSWESIRALYPSLADQEIRPLYKLIYEYKSTFDVAIKKAALREVSDIRTAKTVTAAAVGSVAASAVTHAASTWVTETNVQAALDALGEVAIIATATDNVYQLTATGALTKAFTGSASGQIVRTPNASAMPVGWTRKIKNLSSEFITVDNGAVGTLLAWIKPGDTVEITLVAASSAGTWRVSVIRAAYPDPGINRFDDFLFVNATYALGEGWLISNTGAGAATGSSVATIAGCVGLADQQTGTDTTGCTSNFSGTVNVGGGAILIRDHINIPTLPSSAEDFAYEMGLWQTNNALEGTNGILLRAPTNASGLTTWHGYSISGSTPTAVNSGVTVTAGTNYALTFVVNSAGTRVDFWIGHTYAGSSTTNIPASSQYLYFGSKIKKNAGTTMRRIWLDSFEYQICRSAPRW